MAMSMNELQTRHLELITLSTSARIYRHLMDALEKQFRLDM